MMKGHNIMESQIDIEMIGSDSEDEKLPKQKTLDSFFKIPSKSTGTPLTHKSNTDPPRSSVKKGPVTGSKLDFHQNHCTKAKTNSQDEGYGLNSFSDFEQENAKHGSGTKREIKKCKLTKIRKVNLKINHNTDDKKVNDVSDDTTNGHSSSLEPALEEVSYLDFLNHQSASTAALDDSVILIDDHKLNHSMAEETSQGKCDEKQSRKLDEAWIKVEEKSQSDAPVVVANDEECDLTEALSMLDNSGVSTEDKGLTAETKEEKQDPEDHQMDATEISPKQNGDVDNGEEQVMDAAAANEEQGTEQVKKTAKRLRRKKSKDTKEAEQAEGTRTHCENKTKKKKKIKEAALCDIGEYVKSKGKPSKKEPTDEVEKVQREGLRDELEDDPDALPSKPPKGCVAITSFFAAGPREGIAKNIEQEEDFSEVTVVAEVHPEPSPSGPDKIFNFSSNKTQTLKVSPKKEKKPRKTQGRKCNGVAAEQDFDLSITHIDTSFITVVDKKAKKQPIIIDDESREVGEVCSNEEEGSGELVQKDEAKVAVGEDEPVPVENATSNSPINRKGLTENEIMGNIEIIEVKTDADSIEEEKVLEAEQKAARQAVLTAQINALDNIKISEKKTSQATLNFGGKGMVLQKAAVKKEVQPKAARTRKKSRTEHSEDEADCFLTPPSKKKKKATTPDTKPPKNSTPCVNPEDSTLQNKKKAKSKPTKKCKTPEAETTPPASDRQSRRETRSKTETEHTEPLTPRKRRTLGGVYTSKFLHPVRGKKRTPLKLRLTRVSEKPVETDISPAQPKAKKKLSLNKAQKLLQKAKNNPSPGAKATSVTSKRSTQKGRKKPVSSPVTSPPSELRRSSRSSSQTARQAISICYEDSIISRKKHVDKSVEREAEVKQKPEAKIVNTPKKTKSGKAASTPKKGQPDKLQNTPKKEKLGKTPSKSKKKAGNLASIFHKVGQKTTKKESPIQISDEEVELTEEQKENQRIRRQFLLSGVPQTLKKQIVLQESVALEEYAPIPRVSHVLQASATSENERDLGCGSPVPQSLVDPWKLPGNPLSCIRYKVHSCLQESSLHWSTSVPLLGDLTCCKSVTESCKMPEKKHQPTEPLKEETVRLLLAEIATHNPLFPVRRMYRQLCARKKEAEKEEMIQCQPDAPKQEDLSEKSNSKKHKSPERKKTAGNKRRRKSSDDDVIVVETTAPKVDEVLQKCKNPDLHWSEKYSPTSSNEILGHTGNIKKLKSWLVEWKHRTDLEMRKLRKEQLKQAKKEGKTKEEIKNKLGDDWWMSDESDFDLSDDSESSDGEEEDFFCNTTLLTGPHGVGKTSAVYALAQELGYKVFEVNASSRRSGKQILAQLQEATQSHQVSKTKLDAVYSSLLTNSKVNPVEDKTKPKQEKKLPTSFANFFKTTQKVDETSTKDDASDPPKTRGRPRKTRPRAESVSDVQEEKPAKKTKRRSRDAKIPPTSNKGEEKSGAVPKKGLHLSSVSLILFDEVDLVFEEDKGFWTAIQTFMSTTKRPIILTATDNNFLEKFKGRVEHHALKKLSVPNVTSYLQVLCLAESLRTSYHDVHPLVAMYNCDIRKLLLTVQWWIESGACAEPHCAPIRYKKKCLKEKSERDENGQMFQATPSKCSLMSTHNDSADEFELQKPKKRARRCIIDDDESTRDSFKFQSPVKSLQMGLSYLHDEGSSQGFPMLCSQDSQMCSQSDLVEVPADPDTPFVQDFLFTSVSGVGQCVRHISGSEGLLQMFQEGCVSRDAQLFVCSQFMEHQMSFLYNNIQNLLPLSKVRHVMRAPPCVVTDTPTKQPASRRRLRILNTDDLFDSEASTDGFVTMSQSSQCSDTGYLSESTKQDSNRNNIPVNRSQSTDPNVNRLIQDSLSSLSEYYDSVSWADCYLEQPHNENSVHSRHRFEFDRTRGRVVAGQTDHAAQTDCVANRGLTIDLQASVGLGNLHRCRRQLNTVRDSAEVLEPDHRVAAWDNLSIPVEEISNRLRVTSEDTARSSLAQCACRAAEDVVHLLPHSVTGHRVPLYTEYLPTLRAVCKMEQCRMAVQNKRRFFHYLEPLVHQMKKSTLNTLCTSLQ